MLAAAFDFKLEHEVKDNLVTIGKCKCQTLNKPNLNISLLSYNFTNA